MIVPLLFFKTCLVIFFPILMNVFIFFFSKDKHCYDEPDVMPALHIHYYTHKPICGIDFMQIFSGICINKVLINTFEETSVLLDTKVFLIMKGKVRCPQVKLNKWIAIKKHSEFCTLDLLFLCGGIIIKNNAT